MAVVDRNGKTVGSNAGGSTAGAVDKVELQPITLEELKKKGLLGTTVQLDLEEDAWSRSAPPPKGRYRLRIFLGRDGFKYGYLNPKDPKDSDVYVTAPLECKIVSDNRDYDGVTVFAGVSTRVYRGKNISTVIGMIVKGLGPKAIPKNNLNTYEQIQLFSGFLKKEPIIEAHLDWRGSYQEADGSYNNLLKRYEDFPDDEESTETPRAKLHICRVTRKDGGTEEVNAQLFVSHWYAKGEADIVEKVGTLDKGGKAISPVTPVTPIQQGQSSIQPIQPIVVPQVVNGPIQQSLPLQQPQPQHQQQPQQQISQQQVDDDMALLLTE